jgi:perosamine synthetase
LNPVLFTQPYFFAEEAEAAAASVRSRWVVGGPRQAEFEKRFAAMCGAREAVAASSWTTGAFLVLHAWGIGPRDEVIVPSLTFIASVNVIAHAGARPIFADIDPRSWNIDPADIEARITPRTKAIIAVDQIGLPCDIDAINAIAARHGLRVLQDAACSFASTYKGQPTGARCDLAVYSLHARKIVTTGEGGMITTNDSALAARLRQLRHQGMSLSDFVRHGMKPTTFESYPEIGYNFRMTDIQAAIGLAQLDRLPDILAQRRRVADAYNHRLAGNRLLAPPFVPNDAEPNWQSYMVAVRPNAPMSRNQIMDALYKRSIPTRRGVMASHLEPPYQGLGERLPHTEHASANTLQLPMHPGLSDDQVTQVMDAVDAVTVLAFG